MERTFIKNLKINETQKIQGFLEYLRDKKRMVFLIVRDMSGKVQITVDKDAHPDLSGLMNRLTPGSVLTIEGTVIENQNVKLNGIEVLPHSILVESAAEVIPLQQNAPIDLRLDYRWLDLRGERQQMIFKVQTCLTAAMRRFLLERDFTEIHTPKLVAAASESGAEVFEVKYFNEKAYLAQSPQFYKQMAMAGGLERVFEFGPVFRAEKSYTNRHTTEFTGFDLELSYISSYEDVMHLEEALLAFSLGCIKEAYGSDIKRLFGVEVVVPSLPFPVIRLHDLYDELEKRYAYIVPEPEKGDTTTAAEQLCRHYAREVYGHEFLFITDYSAERRAFYHMRKDNVSQGYDLLWNGVEITTGAQREHRYEILRAQAKEKGLDEDVKFFTEFFRYGCPPHGGFGLGVDRLTMMLLNISIKEAMFLFRGPNRLTP